MLQWLRLMLWLLLIAAVSGKEVECDEVDNYNYCWNSQTYLFVDCWRCTIKNQRITQNEVITISPKLANGTIVDVGFVKFDGGDVAKMIKVINKSKSKQILQVILKGTNTRVLNSAFFGNTAQSLKLFWSNGNNDLSVEAYAFQNCATLEVLDLDYNGITSIPPNTFFGLDKLIRLDLRSNQLSEINENSFSGLHNLELLILNQNQLEEISGASFDQLHKLKELHLHENKIEIITKRMFQNNQQLQIVDLNKNQIKIIQSGAFANLKKLTELYLNRNKCINNYFEKKSSEEISAALTACLPIDSTACLIPVILNGYIVNTEDNAIQTVGDSIEDFESMQVICHPTYQMFQTKAKPTAVGCFDQKWQDQWPQCHKSCPYQEITGMTISAACKRNGQEFSCTGHLLPDTKAYIRCRSGYEEPVRPIKPELTCLPSGQWSHPAHQCSPTCGKVTVHSAPRIYNGKNINVTEVPWHVGVYRKSEQICGGTIVSERVVISAAHCFSMATDGNHEIDHKLYQVATGKILRGLNEREIPMEQIRAVQEVGISLSYNGYITWRADLATVTIVGHFEYQPHVAPACLQFPEYHALSYPAAGTEGRVAGWGFNKDFISSDILQSFVIPTVDFATCRARAPFDFKDKVIGDKICAGFVESDQSSSKVVCQGDSGGGFLVPQTRGNDQRFYLQGVVSNGPKTLDCDRTFYTLFTNVQDYGDIINAAIARSTDF